MRGHSDRVPVDVALLVLFAIAAFAWIVGFVPQPVAGQRIAPLRAPPVGATDGAFRPTMCPSSRSGAAQALRRAYRFVAD